MVAYPVSSIPREWTPDSEVAPIVIVPGSEQLGLSPVSDPSVESLANPLLGNNTEKPSYVVLPKMVTDWQRTISPSLPDETLVDDHDEWFEPVLDAASSEGVLGWRISNYAVPNSKTLNDSLEVAFRLTGVYSSALHQFGLTTSIPIDYMGLLNSCRFRIF